MAPASSHPETPVSGYKPASKEYFPMNAITNIWVIVPAAGVGQRMGGDRPKQYLPLLDGCVLQVTLNKLLAIPAVGQILVALSPEDRYFPEYINVHKRITRIDGGSERAHSVFSGLEYLLARGKAEDWVLVHDAARPCFSRLGVERLLAAAERNQQGAMLAAATADTLKRVVDGKVQCTVDRSHIWLAHTPQLFPVGVLHRAFQQAFADGHLVTDEASAMEYIGLHPEVVPDSRDNLKITQPEDLALAEWILRRQGYPETF